MWSSYAIVYNIAAKTACVTYWYCNLWVSCRSNLTWHNCWNLLWVCYCNYLFSRAILSSKNSNVWVVVWIVRKRLKETFNRFLNCDSDIIAYLNIAKYLNITSCIFESVKLSIKNRSWKVLEKRYKEAFANFLFLMTRLSLVL